MASLVQQFRRQARSLAAELRVESEAQWELLGRHHGLPTSVLDFTRSPYAAVYFAFAELPPPGATHAAVWMLDREAFVGDIPELEILDEEDDIRFNPRAQEQQGLFLKIKDVRPVEPLLGRHLERHDIPTGVPERALVLSALDSMMITARHLFRDLDGAARTAAVNVLVLGQK